MTAPVSPVLLRLEGPAPEVSISKDLVRRGLIVAPALVAACGAVWGLNGALSALFAIGLVLLNFALSAAIVSTTAKISLGIMMGAVLFGYLIRLGLILVAVLLVKDAAWISRPALGAAIIITHLGLLAWELKYLAISLAQPGLKPSRPTR
jgi:hypothetical protein